MEFSIHIRYVTGCYWYMTGIEKPKSISKRLRAGVNSPLTEDLHEDEHLKQR